MVNHPIPTKFLDETDRIQQIDSWKRDFAQMAFKELKIADRILKSGLILMSQDMRAAYHQACRAVGIVDDGSIGYFATRGQLITIMEFKRRIWLRDTMRHLEIAEKAIDQLVKWFPKELQNALSESNARHGLQLSDPFGQSGRKGLIAAFAAAKPVLYPKKEAA